MGLTIATATTNAVPGSIVEVKVEDIICSLAIVPNAFGDTLPVITTASRVENNRILYTIILKAKLVEHADGSPVGVHPLSIQSNRTADRIKSKGSTDANGEMTLTLETREAGILELKITTANISMPDFQLELKEAWYLSPFLITGYNVCEEADFTGSLVHGNGLNEKHKEDFLFGAAGVPMQGTGKEIGGRYIRLGSMAGGWHLNGAGHRDHVNSQAGLTFSYADAIKGAFANVAENHSIAVDPRVIPRRARVNIEGIGERSADDRGSAIQNYHIDNFLGSGKAVVTAWLHGGINGTECRVKYLGGSK